MRATILSFSVASGSSKIEATCLRWLVRSLNETALIASLASKVRASGSTLRISCPSNSLVETYSELIFSYSVVSLPRGKGAW